MDLSVVTTARMCLCTIRRSWAMGTEPCRREMQSILRSFKAPKGPRPPTSRKTAAERLHRIMKIGRQFVPSAGHFYFWKVKQGAASFGERLVARKRLQVDRRVRSAAA